jgi:hypothetical protein
MSGSFPTASHLKGVQRLAPRWIIVARAITSYCALSRPARPSRLRLKLSGLLCLLIIILDVGKYKASAIYLLADEYNVA